MKNFSRFLFSLLFLLSFFTLSNLSFASQFLSSDNLVVTEDIIEDTYIFAGNVNLDADIYGDVYLMGGTVTITGNIAEDLIILGGQVKVNGNVGGDLRLLGGYVSLYGDVNEDLLVSGGSIDIGPDSVIMGSIDAATAYLSIEGDIMGDLKGFIGMFLLNGEIFGNVQITVEDTISITKDSKVHGDFNYTALIETRFPEGTINGDIRFNEFVEDQKYDNETSDEKLYMAFSVFSFLSSLLLALIFILLSPKFIQESSKVSRENLLKTFLIGFLATIIIMIAPIILIMTVLGIPIAIIAVAGYIISLFIAKIFTAFTFSGYIINFKKTKRLKLRLFLSTALFILIFNLISLVPYYVGTISGIAIFFIGLGSIVLTKTSYIKKLKAKKLI